MKDIIYWIWYALRCGAGSSDGVRLIEYYARSGEECPPKRIYEAGRDELLGIGKFDPSFISRFADHDLSRAEDIIEFCFMGGIRIVSCASEHYPERLKGLYNRPIVLYCRGNIEALDDKFSVGVVGTRAMTNYGKHIAFDITRKLCAHNAVIISGAANGIDSVANQTALYFESPTIAVLGCGVNVAYPAENKIMLDQIAEHGMLVSEFAPNTPPSKYSFPIRNRIISGLSDALLVVEAGERSGALITARHAADQGRPVYAVPGNVNSPESRGTNLLIRDGAYLCASAEDILRDFADRMNLSPNEMLTRSEKYLHYELRATKPLPERDLSDPSGRDRSSAKSDQPEGQPRAAKANVAARHADGRPTGVKPPETVRSNADEPRGNAVPRDNLKPASALLKDTGTADMKSNEAVHTEAAQPIQDRPRDSAAKPAVSSSDRDGCTQSAQDRPRDSAAKPAVSSHDHDGYTQSAQDRPRDSAAKPANSLPNNSGFRSIQSRSQNAAPTEKPSFDKSRLNPLQLRIYNLLPEDGSAVSPDKLTRDDLPTSDVLATLTILELYSAVESLPGGLFRRNI